MKYYPAHLGDSTISAANKFPGKADEYHHFFQVICECGAKLFYLFLSNKRGAGGVCNRCLKNIVIYDLTFYPAASKLEGEEVFWPSDITQKSPGEIFVGYEYGPLDEDQEFDRNDITWCKIFIGKAGKMVNVLDDETS